MNQFNISENSEKKILVVDDQISVTRLLKLTLEETGRFDVITENDALRAIDTAREFKPDVILLDIIMPGIDGHEIAEKIKNDSDFRCTKIIFLSSLLTKRETGTTGKVIGGNMCLAKSVKADNVIACIDKSIGESVVVH